MTRIRVKRRNLQKLKNSRRSAIDRRKTVAAFHVLLRDGLSAGEAAARLRIGLSTIYRDQQVLEARDTGVPMHNAPRINDVIARICLPGGHGAQIDALVDFLCWLRWPSETHHQCLAALCCLSTYIYQTSDLVCSLTQIEHRAMGFLLDRLNIDIIRRMTLGQLFAPYFDLSKFDQTSFDDIEEIIQIVEYFLGHGHTADKKKGASLNKVAYLANHAAFENPRQPSGKFLRTQWHSLGSAGPFWLVARRYSGFHFDLDPKRISFASEIDTILSRPSELLQYMARCKWVVLELEKILDPRLLKRTPLPTLPADLVAVPIDVKPLSQKVRKLLSAYSI